MPKSLIITEKPSVARDIVAALGGFTARAGGAYYESEEYLCSFAVGHILSFLAPEDIDPAYKRWSLSTLPIIPQVFRLKPIPGHEARLKQLAALMERPDVTVLINACDAAREGELIFREIVYYAACAKRVRRLWLQSMTPAAIRQGFAALRDGTELDGLGAAAQCRARTDWLIGMNATRAFSERLRQRGSSANLGPQKASIPWSIGRVQTPTLALLVDRELEILGHRPKDFFRIEAQFAAPTHVYSGTWFDPQFKENAGAKAKNAAAAAFAIGKGAAAAGKAGGKNAVSPDGDAACRDDRIFDRAAADAIVLATKGQPGLGAETREESLRHAPYLFSLTGLQKYMAQRYKWTAKRTLEAAQRCYEQHKVLTYPRTSSSCLPSDYRGVVDSLVQGYRDDLSYGTAARYLLANGRRNEKRTFNDAGVTDHFAIIPTENAARRTQLSGDDAKLYDAVVRRFLANFYPPAVYDKVKRITVVNAHHFRTGPIETLMTPGWQAVYERTQAVEDQGGREKPQPNAKSLPPLHGVAGDTSRVTPPSGAPARGTRGEPVPVHTQDVRVSSEVSKPPTRINEAGLLSLMEHAGRKVENEELAEALMSAEGLGTAATRADIIQNLKAKEYVDADLRPTFKGIHLISILKRLNAARLTSAELTARLEFELAEVEAGKRTGNAFMQAVASYTSEVVEVARGIDWQLVYPDKEAVGRCPLCSGQWVYERPFYYACATVQGPDGGAGSGCGLRLWKDLSGRYLDKGTVELLLGSGTTAELDGFRTPAGKDFKAALRLKAGKIFLQTEKGEVAGEPAAAENTGDTSTPTLRYAAERPVIGLCPLHKNTGTAVPVCSVRETRGAYMCDTRLAAFTAGEQNPQGIMIPKLLCRRPMLAEEVQALLKGGIGTTTAELSGFISKAGRPFMARLRLAEDGGVSFMFAPRGETAAPTARRQGGSASDPAKAPAVRLKREKKSADTSPN